MPVLIQVTTPVSLSIDKLTDLPKLKTFMEQNDIKLNKSEIARQLNINRRTVDKYLSGFEKSKHRDKPSKLEKYRDDIQSLLSSETQVFHFRSDLYRYLTDNHGMDVPEQTFYHYLKSVKEFDDYFRSGRISASPSNPVIRYETPPGEQAQFDWKESIPFVLKDTGEMIRVHILVMVVGHSRLRLFRPSLWMTQDVLIHNLVSCFESLGGVPKVLLTDNMKTVMDEARTLHRRGKVNERFEAFAKDFGFRLVPCIAATPRTKGKVETQMKFLDEISAYSGQLDLVGLFDLVERINERINNSISQGTGKIPMLEFGKEKGFLDPLPNESVRDQYRISTVKAKVNSAGMITVRSRQYSVPCELIGSAVQYQVHDSNIYVYHGAKLVAAHAVSDNRLNYSPEHYEKVLSYRFIGRSSDEVGRLAKRNLEIIGGVYK